MKGTDASTEEPAAKKAKSGKTNQPNRPNRRRRRMAARTRAESGNGTDKDKRDRFASQDRDRKGSENNEKTTNGLNGSKENIEINRTRRERKGSESRERPRRDRSGFEKTKN